MGKVNLNAKLISSEDNLNIKTTGIKTSNKIVYKEEKVTVTILIFSNKIELNRKCNEYNVNLIFEKNKKTISTYTLFGMNKVFDLETITKKLIISDKKIDINYELEGNRVHYLLEIGG